MQVFVSVSDEVLFDFLERGVGEGRLVPFSLDYARPVSDERGGRRESGESWGVPPLDRSSSGI